ncbi:NAD-dependent epimerase/dehydratase family protein [Billgrantia montanilacus]|uniref:NAD(P)-dependent oxidoreductase n=1 Tax=Billgrantia montanilacus TaxID=2282305 RepID=A0A368U1I8_9GAMM|nr:NAD(P)-dependent oxidoreductase [Halomonas montanilacus]RCV90915.1 NAD(P)-dependent oxidoreductase [Halomonas montanilacus]
MKKVLVTGVTGFVGRQVMRALSSPAVKLVPVVREGKEDLVNTLPNVERVVTTADLFAEDVAWWTQQCQGVDVVVHVAWYAEPGKYLQASQNMDCLIGSLNLAKGASNAGVKRMVGVGTCFEYDLTCCILPVDTPLKPLTPYAASKAALYLNLSQWLPAQSIQFAWCRLFYLYGEGEDERRLVPYLRKQLEKGEPAELTSGRQIRDFLDVREAGKKIADIAQGGYVGPVNICSGVPITVRQLAQQIADEYGSRDLLKFGARPDNLVDPSCVLGIPNE